MLLCLQHAIQAAAYVPVQVPVRRLAAVPVIILLLQTLNAQVPDADLACLVLIVWPEACAAGLWSNAGQLSCYRNFLSSITLLFFVALLP